MQWNRIVSSDSKERSTSMRTPRVHNRRKKVAKALRTGTALMTRVPAMTSPFTAVIMLYPEKSAVVEGA